MKSILGFWLLYGLTVLLRAFLDTDPRVTVESRLAMVGFGILINGLIYLAMARFTRGAPVRRKIVVAVISCAIGAPILSAAVVATEERIPLGQEKFRYHAHDGFNIVEIGERVRIERAEQEPLVLTLPNVRELNSDRRLRAELNMAVTWFFFFFGWSAFYIASEAHRAAMVAQRRLAEAESAAQVAHVRALRYQVNPHFLFNTLKSLSSLVITGRTDRAETMLLALSTFFRASLSLDPNADVSLAQEIHLQRLYLDIEIARIPDLLTVEIDVPPELRTILLPAMLLQPIVENAIRYGVSSSRKAVVLRIEARRLDRQRMLLEISNRPKFGVRNDLAAATNEGTGVGLANVCQRMQARWGSRASCCYGPLTGGGFNVSLTMPMETRV